MTHGMYAERDEVCRITESRMSVATEERRGTLVIQPEAGSPLRYIYIYIYISHQTMVLYNRF
jgi:hypothetical protein